MKITKTIRGGVKIFASFSMQQLKYLFVLFFFSSGAWFILWYVH